MKRAAAIAQILSAFPREPIVVTLGTTSREVIAAAPDAPNHIHLLDAMGLAPAVGVGVALGLADRYEGKVVAVEGDGGLLMGFSILATIAHLKPRNFVLVILDDGVYGATGGQRTGSDQVDIDGVARACGIESDDAADLGALETALERARTQSGPRLIRVRIEPITRKLPHYLPDPPTLTERFRRYLADLR
ncbi:MAG TPA: thiamine pyrophosphate-dependent enzyme [Candidatus Polarisedimenticolia bacterium]|nr:thiamine pyrophosphate-dependent enzyme [Candidatus Polarisedimenticolia bacterium]